MSKRQALETAEKLIGAQETLKARLWGSLERAREKAVIVGCTNHAQHPELAALAPHADTFVVGKYTIKRARVDQVDNYYVWRTKTGG